MSKADAKRLGIPASAAGGKYGVSPSRDRTWQGRTYDSRAEMRYAAWAWAQVYDITRPSGFLQDIVEQPRVPLGADTIYRPDFLLIPLVGTPWYVDIKGHVTTEFKRIMKLWAKYGRLRLDLVKSSGGSFPTFDTIRPTIPDSNHGRS